MAQLTAIQEIVAAVCAEPRAASCSTKPYV